MLVMLGIWKPGKKIKERKRAVAARRTGRCSRQSPVALAFSQAAASQSIFFGSLARRKDQWKQQQGERAGRKGNIEGPLVPLGLFLRPAARERCLVLGAWCCTFALAPWAASRALQSYLSEGATRIRIQLWGLALPSFPPWSTYRALDSYRLERPVERRWAGYSPTPQGERPDDDDLAVVEVGGSLGLCSRGQDSAN